MSMDKDYVLTALLQHNFLPMQKKNREEMPPIFSPSTFTPNVARKLVAKKACRSKANQGYDAVDYRLIRFNGVSRSCSLPHPAAYADLAICISECWDKLDYIAANQNSLIRPRRHKDGRLIVMDYEIPFEKTLRSLRGSFGKRFMVHTDISNCFPSIYSHAIPWATVGFKYAKAHKPPEHRAEWYNQLDEKVRWLKRNETQGVAIGPATSNIVTEAILARVDETLRGDCEFFRYIDDYTAYFETENLAREFVRRLAEELAKYKLLLNINKTDIIPLPQALTADWIAELSLRLPKSDKLGVHEAVNYLTWAVDLARETPDGSVLKYALKSVIGRKFGSKAAFGVLRYALTLSFHHPLLLPLLEGLFEVTSLPGAFPYGDELQQLALENALFRRSDGMAWTIYYLNKYKVGIAKNVADKVLESRDCVALMLLYLSGDTTYQDSVVDFVKGLDPTDLYELDQYWLLLYELYRDEKITNLYADDKTFEILKTNSVTFLGSVKAT